jgi:hypothetical protein
VPVLSIATQLFSFYMVKTITNVVSCDGIAFAFPEESVGTRFVRPKSLLHQATNMDAVPISEPLDAPPGEFAPEIPSLEGDIVELAFFLPGWQAQALETAAHDQGLTTAQMLRDLVRQFCGRKQRPVRWQSAGWDD